MDISLTDFVDFVSKVGSTKYTQVKKVHDREEYHPNKDYWKVLRDGIVELHRQNGSRNDLDRLPDGIKVATKAAGYRALIKQYKSFLGRKKIEWFDPPRKDWKKDELNVKLNPELGLDINGHLYVIKLYFKAEPLSQQKVGLILLLLNETFKKRKYKEVTFAVLDIPRKRLFENNKLGKEHLPLLEGEALSFINIWKSLPDITPSKT